MSKTFEELGLSKLLLTAISELDYRTPSPIQEQAIPLVLKGGDVMAAAQTGTGKTAAFTLPLVQRLLESEGKNTSLNRARALVLVPTRELAAQVAANVGDYAKNTDINSVVVFGGVSINPQMKKLRGGVDILIATPGRLLDLVGQNAVQLDAIETLVLDEADRMLDMGFIHDINRILKLVPKKRQTLLFSATFSSEIRELARRIVFKPSEVSVTPPNSTVEKVSQSLIAVEKSDKTMILRRLITEGDWHQVLVFSRTKHGANRLATKLAAKGIEAMAIHGNKSQGARTRALETFKAGKTRVLVATDIAARGIDIDKLPYVVNFDLPHVSEDYVHRIGRTGRAGSSGRAVSLVSHDEYKQLLDIERFIKRLIPRESLDGYEPLNELPESTGDFKKRKPKKPKNKKPSGNGKTRAKQDTGVQSAKGKRRSRKPNQNKDSRVKKANSNAEKSQKNTSEQGRESNRQRSADATRSSTKRRSGRTPFSKSNKAVARIG